jgi:hypothetical protein
MQNIAELFRDIGEQLNKNKAAAETKKTERKAKNQAKRDNLKNRNEAKIKLLNLSSQLFKNNMIDRPLFRKMWNIANPTSAYQLKSIQNSIETLQSLSTNESNQVIKKRDFIPKSKEIKNSRNESNTVIKKRDFIPKSKEIKQVFKQISDNSFRFYKNPNEKDILNVADIFYKNIDFQIPKNHDYINFKKQIKKTYIYPFSGYFTDLNKFVNEIFNKQKFTFKINISFGYTLITEEKETLGAGNYDDADVYKISFKFFDASTNTRIFKNPVLIDNKKDVEKFVMLVKMKK